MHLSFKYYYNNNNTRLVTLLVLWPLIWAQFSSILWKFIANKPCKSAKPARRTSLTEHNSLIHSCTRALTHWLVHSFIHLLIQSFSCAVNMIKFLCFDSFWARLGPTSFSSRQFEWGNVKGERKRKGMQVLPLCSGTNLLNSLEFAIKCTSTKFSLSRLPQVGISGIFFYLSQEYFKYIQDKGRKVVWHVKEGFIPCRMTITVENLFFSSTKYKITNFKITVRYWDQFKTPQLLRMRIR